MISEWFYRSLDTPMGKPIVKLDKAKKTIKYCLLSCVTQLIITCTYYERKERRLLGVACSTFIFSIFGVMIFCLALH